MEFSRPSWIPIVAADPERFALACSDGAQPRVLRVCWEPDERLQHTGVICPTPADWLEAIAARFRAGDYLWDAADERLAPAEHVAQLAVPACGRP